MSDLLNGLRHMADDHPCCAGTIGWTVNRIDELERENAQLKKAVYAAMHMADDLAALRKECARLQMELDATCNAEELRQVRAENAALREDKARLAAALRNMLRQFDYTNPTRLEAAVCEAARAALDAALKEAKS